MSKYTQLLSEQFVKSDSGLWCTNLTLKYIVFKCSTALIQYQGFCSFIMETMFFFFAIKFAASGQTAFYSVGMVLCVLLTLFYHAYHCGLQALVWMGVPNWIQNHLLCLCLFLPPFMYIWLHYDGWFQFRTSLDASPRIPQLFILETVFF